MIRKRTTFVLGAGFSAELGMPVGGVLAGQILKLLKKALEPDREDAEIWEAFRGGLPQQDNQLVDTLRTMSRALPHALSIDNLVEHYNDLPALERCAKIAITYAILEAESKSVLRVKELGGRPPIENAKGSAMQALFSLIVQNVGRFGLEDAFRNVGFINFNYDRCFDAFMTHAVSEHSNLPLEDCANLISGLKHWRPYGRVGALRSVSTQRGPGYVNFGHIATPILAEVAQGIRTFSESRRDEDMEEARAWLFGSQQIVFLGCAYHPQNLQLLVAPGEVRIAEAQIYGTYYRPPTPDPDKNAIPTMEEFVEPAVDALKKQLGRQLLGHGSFRPGFTYLQPLTCRQLVEMYDHTWTAG